LAESSIPVVLLVEASTQRLRNRASEAGIVSIVEKPRLGRVLLDAVEDAIDGRGRMTPSGETRSGWRLPPFLRSSP
jgi:FixJ family two-component response regulator